MVKFLNGITADSVLILCVLMMFVVSGLLIGSAILADDADEAYCQIPADSLSAYLPASGEIYPSVSAVDRLIDQAATERAGRLLAEERLLAVQEENERLRLQLSGQ